jgi:2'-5' RNA ligase
MRLFLAVRLPEPARERLRPALEAGRTAAGASVGFARIEQLHFTLAFLGEQPEEALARACEAAEKASELPQFELAISGRGAFPGMSRPRVLWLGVGEGAAALTALAEKLCGGLRERGFKLEDRPFRPHLTLARVRPRGDRDARRALEAIPPGELTRFTVRELSLMQSVLGSSGAKHTELRAFPLGGAETHAVPRL